MLGVNFLESRSESIEFLAHSLDSALRNVETPGAPSDYIIDVIEMKGCDIGQRIMIQNPTLGTPVYLSGQA